MKHLVLVLAILFSSLAVMAQKGAVSSADYELEMDRPNYLKAKEKIDLAVKDEKTKDYPKTYIVLSKVYRSYFEKEKSNDPSLLEAALAGILKAEELDIEGDAKGKKKLRFRNEIITEMSLLRAALINSGVEAYKQKDYKGAHMSFAQALKIDDSESYKSANVIVNPYKETIDTAIVFNAGVTGYYAYNGNDEEMVEPTIKFLNIAKDKDYGGDALYKMLLTMYRDTKDTVAYVDIMKEGMLKFPEEPVFIRELVAYYVTKGDAGPALLYLNKAIEQDPSNDKFWFAKGTFHDQMGEVDKAIECYNKITNNPSADPLVALDAYYNLGVIAFNKARDLDNIAKDELDNKKYKVLDMEASKEFEKCLPYFQSALKVNPENKAVLDVLKKIYYRLTRFDKKYEVLYKETDDVLKSLM